MIRVIGVDPAARRDRFAVAIVHGEAGRYRVVYVDAATGVDFEQMSPLVLDYLADEDRRARRVDALGCAIDATGIGAAPAEQLHKRLTAVEGYRSASGLVRPVAFRGVILTGGNDIVTGSRRYLVNGSRALLIGNFVMGVRTGAVTADGLDPSMQALLAKELQTFTQRTMPNGKVRMAHNASGNDDVLWACALGYWLAVTLAGSVTTIGIPHGRSESAVRSRMTSGYDPMRNAAHLAAVREQPDEPERLPPELLARLGR